MPEPTTHIDFIEFQKAGEVQSVQTDNRPYGSNYADTVDPQFNKTVLRNLYQTCDIHAICINKTAEITCLSGFEFEDEDNAESSGVKAFLANLYDKDNNPAPFEQLNKQLMQDFLVFGELAIEKARLTKMELHNIFPLSTRNLYTNETRDKLYQINDFTQKVVTFEYNRGAEAEAAILRNRSNLDDFYGVPDYVAGVERIANVKKGVEAENSILDEVASFGYKLIGTGGFISDPDIVKLKEQVRLAKNKKGGTFVYFNTDPNFKLDFSSIYDDRALNGKQANNNDNVVMALHGVTPELFGMLNKGGINSGDKASGAFKMFVQTKIIPLQNLLSAFWDKLFKDEFPAYNTKLLWKRPSFDEEIDKLNSEMVRVNIISSYKALNSLDLLNEFMQQFNYPEITAEQWEAMTVNDLYSYTRESQIRDTNSLLTSQTNE